MVVHTKRSPAEEQLVAAFRGVFDASVMNFGSYNLVYAENLLAAGRQSEAASNGRRGAADSSSSGHEGPGSPSSEPGSPAGRRGQAEEELSVQEAVASSRHLLVGYRREPVEIVLCPVDLDQTLARLGEYDDAVAMAQVPALLNLTNLAGMATEGSTVQIVFSTGRRLTLSLQPEVQFPQAEQVPLHQHLDLEDFYDFLDYFMDRVEQKQL